MPKKQTIKDMQRVIDNLQARVDHLTSKSEALTKALWDLMEPLVRDAAEDVADDKVSNISVSTW